jgi:cytochrome c peroxidase
VFDLDGGNPVRDVDLGYATADYPATNMERGEYLFYNADWSNNGRKSCAGCHTDELLADGIGYSNGATAPTAYHQVRPNYNLATTDSYFWNGSFANGSYASLASDAQTRTNCELILFGMIEGPASDPDTRIGDPNNRVSDGQDAGCRPDTSGAGVLPDNFDQIQQIIAAQKQIKNQLVELETGLDFDTVTRLTDFYSVSELRLPPNPLRYLYDAEELDSATTAAIAHGKEVFQAAGCGNCHDPGNPRHPFTDGLEHGGGVEWRTEFVNTYFNDQRILDQIPTGIPQAMVEAISASVADDEINVHLDPIDYFVPFCFDVTSCLFFEDPLAVRGNLAGESERLDLLVTFNLGNADRGFVPGNVRGRPATNTPSLRGIWWQANYLRHGLARTLNEAVLAPGHPALREGERGYAVNALGKIDVHGTTSDLSEHDVDDLRLYLYAIQ